MTIGLDELQLAARNHGLPLEALRWDVTPVGLHYLLIHYDIPAVDPAAWRLELGGRVERPLVARPRRPAPRARREHASSTMECAGNGRAGWSRALSASRGCSRRSARPLGGVALADLLAEAGPLDDAVDVVFTGLDGGIEGGVEQRYERCCRSPRRRRPTCCSRST